MKQIPKEVLVNPRPKQIQAALAKADAMANPPKSKSRNCHFPTDLAKKIRGRKEGIFEDDGGAVANSYTYSAETSHLLAVWWTSGNGTRYVRITGRRVGAAKHSHGSGNGTSHAKGTPWEIVFPSRDAALLDSVHGRAMLAILRCGVWPHWTPEDILHVFAARHGKSSRMGRVNDLRGLAAMLLPEAIRGQRGLRLVAVSPRGVIVATKHSGWLIVRQHDLCLCELLLVPPRFRELNGRTNAELIEAAMEYAKKKANS